MPKANYFRPRFLRCIRILFSNSQQTNFKSVTIYSQAKFTLEQFLQLWLQLLNAVPRRLLLLLRVILHMHSVLWDNLLKYCLPHLMSDQRISNFPSLLLPVDHLERWSELVKQLMGPQDLRDPGPSLETGHNWCPWSIHIPCNELVELVMTLQ